MTNTTQLTSQLTSGHPLVTITSGIVQGKSTPGYDFFLGIPFAEPPVGALRFQLPVPVIPWEGVFDASVYGSPPPAARTAGTVSVFEDAEITTRDDDYWLSVNVWAPKNAKNSPVFVWIYGGAFLLGANSKPYMMVMLSRKVE